MVLWDTSKEDENEFIEKVHELITKYEMEVPAVLLLESIKPLVWVGGGLLRISLTPFMMFFWKEGHSFIDTFEKRQNIEKLIKMLEEKHKEEKTRKEKESKVEEEAANKEEPTKEAKKGWSRFLRF
jgi:hypothetical protein